MLKTLFNPTKFQALGLGVGFSFLLWFVLANINSSPICGCIGWITFLTAVAYGVVTYNKFMRDKRLADQAVIARVEPAQVWESLADRQTTSGSEWIGVPDPLPDGE